MKRKNEIKLKIAGELQLPKGAVTETYKIEFQGSEEVSVIGCKGVIEYSDSVIALNLGSETATFRGRDLEIREFSEAQAILIGTVAVMEFSS